MSRLARVVVPGAPHHITQRGNRRQQVFFCEDDYIRYLDLMEEWCARSGVEIWGYCLMPNHVHLIVVPDEEKALSRAIGEAHRRYTCYINSRENWKGYLWQGRFSSFPMDEQYLLAAARYVELNPVRAKLVEKAWDYPWSSVHAHLGTKDEVCVMAAPLLQRVDNWKEFISINAEENHDVFRRHERTGRPVGGEGFFQRIKDITGRDLRPKKPGRKRVVD